MNTTFVPDLAILDALLKAEGIGPSVINVINNYLIGLGDTTGLADRRDLISGQSGTPPFAVADVLNVTSSGAFKIQTVDGEQLIVVQHGAANIHDAGTAVHIGGHIRVLAVTGDGDNDTLSNNYHARHDTFRAGGGLGDVLETHAESSSLKGGSGSGDVLLARASSLDTLVAGSGRDQNLEAFHGNGDYLKGGSGYGDTIGSSGGGWANLYAGNGDEQLLSARGKFDWLQGGNGVGLTMTAKGADNTLLTGTRDDEMLRAVGRDDSIYAGGAGGSRDGGGTLFGGSYNTQYHIGAHGSDTINGGGSDGTVFFDAQAYGSGSGISITTHGSVTTVQFSDTDQRIRIDGVTTLQFSDGHVVHI